MVLPPEYIVGIWNIASGHRLYPKRSETPQADSSGEDSSFTDDDSLCMAAIVTDDTVAPGDADDDAVPPYESGSLRRY